MLWICHFQLLILSKKLAILYTAGYLKDNAGAFAGQKPLVKSFWSVPVRIIG